MLNRTVRSQVAERRGRLNLTNEWIPRVVTPHWKVSFFLSWILPRVKLRRRVYHLGDGANQSSDSQWRPYCSLWDVHPRVWYKAKGKKNWNNQHINERRVIWGGQPWLMWRQTRVHGQRLCTGELWEFVMNSVAW